MKNQPWYVYPLKIALSLAALATGLRMLGENPDHGLPFKTFFLAVLLLATTGGLEAGLLAVILSAFSINTLANPNFSFTWQTLQTYSGPNLIFLLTGLLTCFAIEAIKVYSRPYRQEILSKTKLCSALNHANQRLTKRLHQLTAKIVSQTPPTEAQEAHAQQRNQAVIDQHFYNYPWWTDDPKVRAQVSKALHAAKHGEALRFDLPVKIGDAIIPMDLQISPVCDETGKLTGIFTTALDISLRQQATAQPPPPESTTSLTKLPTHQALHERLKLAQAHAKRSKNFGAILALSMDKFKSLYEQHGQDYSDELLNQVAERLQACVREVDALAHCNADEFILLLEDLQGNANDAAQKAVSVAEKIRATLNEYFEIKGEIHFNSPSIGIALFNAQTTAADNLLQQANSALQQAKNRGGNTIQLYQSPKTP